MNIKNLYVVVVYGGISSEREVSLRSGLAVYKALKRKGLNVELFDLTGANISELIEKKPDVCYLALHGKGGEDGCIQGALELAGIPYTGPGVSASALCMDKILTKRILFSAGIPTARFLTLNRKEYKSNEEIKKFLEKEFSYPIVLKSPLQGSSIGVAIVNSGVKLLEELNTVFSFGDIILVEEYIDGVEVTLPIIGNDRIQMLPIIEIQSTNDFYDYESKYTEGMFRHIIPASIDYDTAQEVAKIGENVYRLMGCKGLSRIDFIVDKYKGPIVIEVNTLPGMTETSLVPDSARYQGISFEDLCYNIVELALEE